MISVIVPTYERSASLRLCLQALALQSFDAFEIIVVDDGSEYFDVAIDFGVRYIWHPHYGFGLAKSRNEGAKLAKGEVLHFVDSDIMLNPNALKEAWRLYQNNPNRAIGGYYKYLPGMEIRPSDVMNWDAIWNCTLPKKDVGQTLVPEGQDVREAWYENSKWGRSPSIGENPFDYNDDVLWSPFVFLGGNMIIPRHIFEKTGGFDEHFNMYGGEDAEMSLAIISRGYGISYSKEVAGCHIAHPKNPQAVSVGEDVHRRYIATKYPYFLHKDGSPRTEVWGLPVERKDD